MGWVQDIFEANEAREGALVRRQISDVEGRNCYDELLGEVRTRGFHLLEVADQYVIICSDAPLQVHC